MTSTLEIGGALLSAYLLGSIPWGFLFGKAKGVDLRKIGSGNIGATNAARVLGKPIGLAVLLLDAAKGYVACRWLPGLWVDHPEQWLLLAAGIAAVLGHNFPCWLRFRGGKGIATSTGVLLALMPKALGICAVVWAVVFAVFRIVSLASMVAAGCLPVAVWWTGGSRLLLGFAIFLAVMAIYRHRANLRRLLAGTEPRFGQKPTGQNGALGGVSDSEVPESKGKTQRKE